MRENRHIALIANGILDFSQKFAKKRNLFSRIVAVDGGLKHCETLKISPHLIIGDFDSAPKKLLQKFSDIEQRSYPEDKNETDLEIALKEVIRSDVCITVFGGFGARVDHTLANLVLLSRYPKTVVFETDQETIFAINKDKEVDLENREGQRISLIPINGPARVSSKGLKWELCDTVLDKQFVGISNKILRPKAWLSVHEGDVLCFVETL